MGRVIAVMVHTHLFEGIIHPLADHRCGNTQVLRAKCHILLHHVGNDLVIGILENHPHSSAHSDQQLGVGGVHSADVHLSATGKQNAVKMLGKGGFSAAVAAKNSNKGALFYGKA